MQPTLARPTDGKPGQNKYTTEGNAISRLVNDTVASPDYTEASLSPYGDNRFEGDDAISSTAEAVHSIEASRSLHEHKAVSKDLTDHQGAHITEDLKGLVHKVQPTVQSTLPWPSEDNPTGPREGY